MVINSLEDFNSWFREQPLDKKLAISTRAALRVFPLTIGDKIIIETHPNLIGKIGRAILTAIVASKFKHMSFKEPAQQAVNALEEQSIQNDSILAATRSAQAVTGSIDAAIAAVTNVNKAISKQALDAAYSDTQIDEGNLFSAKLWHDQSIPQLVIKHYTAFQNMTDEIGELEFWREWYQSIIDAEPMDWNMLREIVLIPNDDWIQGPRYISRKINFIRSHFIDFGRNINFRNNQKKIPSREDIEALQDKVNAITNLASTQFEYADSIEKKIAGFSNDLNKRTAGMNTAMEGMTKHLGEIGKETKEQFKALSAAFAEENALSAPVGLWETKREEHVISKWTSFVLFLIGLFLVVATTFVALRFTINNGGAMNELFAPIGCNIRIPENCDGFSFKALIVSVGALTIITALLWFTRLQMKLFLAERHLALDARERKAFAQVYVGLLKQQDTSDDAKEARGLVYAALFRPTVDGIIKEEGGLDPSVSSVISKLLMKQ